MKKELINLGAKTRGERWFQVAISNASNLGWSRFFMIAGFILLFIYSIFFFDFSGGEVFLLMGVGWICAGLVHYERHHARKVIIRLMNTNSDRGALNDTYKITEE